MADADKRIVVTGIGLVTPVGIGIDNTWSALCAGQSGIGSITRFDPSGHTTQIAGEVDDFHAEDFMSKKDAKRSERFMAFAVATARMALEDAGMEIDDRMAPRIGVITGCGLGGLSAL